MLTDKLKLALACTIALLLLLTLIPLGIHSTALQSQLDAAETDLKAQGAELAIKQMEITGLASTVSEQNDKITAFEKNMARMVEARLKAQKEAEQKIKQLSGNIARLEAEKAAGCTADGMRNKILREVMQ